MKEMFPTDMLEINAVEAARNIDAMHVFHAATEDNSVQPKLLCGILAAIYEIQRRLNIDFPFRLAQIKEQLLGERNKFYSDEVLVLALKFLTERGFLKTYTTSTNTYWHITEKGAAVAIFSISCSQSSGVDEYADLVGPSHSPHLSINQVEEKIGISA